MDWVLKYFKFTANMWGLSERLMFHKIQIRNSGRLEYLNIAVSEIVIYFSRKFHKFGICKFVMISLCIYNDGKTFITFFLNVILLVPSGGICDVSMPLKAPLL